MAVNERHSEHFCCHSSENCFLTADPTFYDKLHQLATQVCRQVALNLEIPSPSDDLVSLLPPSVHQHRKQGIIDLIDCRLHPENQGLAFRIGTEFDKQRQSVCLAILSELEHFVKQSAPGSLTPAVYLTIFLAIEVRNEIFFKSGMERITGNLSPCLCQSLLIDSAEAVFYPAVEILFLETQLPTDCALNNKSHIYCNPICIALDQYYQIFDESKEHCLELGKIVGLLLPKAEKAEIFYPSLIFEGEYYSAMNPIAIHTPELALQIIERITPTLSDTQNRCWGGYSGFDNLFDHALNAAISALQLSSEKGETLKSVVRVFQFLFLPLLRAGFRHRPEGLRYCSRAVFYLISNIRQFHFQHCETAVLLFAMEFHQFFSYDNSFAIEQTHKNQIRDLFPRPLQFISRSTIIGRLPFGLKKRQIAIESLNLPQCLTNFLNFTDLDIPSCFYADS